MGESGVCQRCGQENEPVRRLCKHCGAPLLDPELEMEAAEDGTLGPLFLAGTAAGGQTPGAGGGGDLAAAGPAVRDEQGELAGEPPRGAGRLAAEQTVRLLVPAGRRPACAAPPLLRVSFGDSLRRLFVHLAGGEVRCGRRKPARGEDAPNHLVLRLLPCRAPEIDPDNWHATLAISATHLCILAERDGPHVVDVSRNGTWLDGRPLERGAAAPLGAQFQLMLGGVLRLVGRVLRAPAGGACLRLEAQAPLPLPEPEPFDAALPGSCDAIALERVANETEDSYLLLYRRAAIGSAESCAIRLQAAGVQPEHAWLYRHRGTLLLGPSEQGAAATWVDGQLLEAGQALPVGPGSSIRLGEALLGLAAAEPAEMASLPAARLQRRQQGRASPR
ncbi:MAG: hypothetical protein KatS3mg102_1443 [Planctomycetota bacterium]|nr:MAG: hypothetical protein KatS3mg102_1443 [Planctomycetota bacterium]